ncbi:MAG: 3-deoxy-manno-octulosonate cytidylyltransferase [Terriglobia bacterium]
MKAIAIIPARYASTRFPGKPLVLIHQKPMIQHVYERVRLAARVDDVIVATDDQRIVKAVEQFGGKAWMTSSEHNSGTDRVAEVALQQDADLIVNVQGDEPFVDPECVDLLLEPFYSEPDLMISTLCHCINSEEDLYNPNIVKVVTDRKGFALYFSRSPIPFSGSPPNLLKEASLYKRHMGLYAYRKSFLERLPQLQPSLLEKTETLEQLRFLENGYRIKVLTTNYQPLAVDTPDDLLRIDEYLKEQSWQQNSSS